jgi:hypothetical protein
MALSEDGHRLFVVTMDADSRVPSNNYLIDVPSWRIVSEFPRGRGLGESRIDGIPTFRADGRLVFVPRNLDVDVYLNRE